MTWRVPSISLYEEGGLSDGEDGWEEDGEGSDASWETMSNGSGVDGRH
jgi:hypothetical protein